MNFKSPSRVDDVIRRLQDTSMIGDENMARINSLFNGDPPWTQREAKRQKVQINVPSMRAPEIMDRARDQWDTAFASRSKYFRYRLLAGPPEKRLEWSQYYTNCQAEIHKANRKFLNTISEVGASVMLHGRGPLHWPDEDSWPPDMIGLGDLKIPARTYTSFWNLGYYATYVRHTPFTLYNSAFGDTPSPQWNKPLIKEIIARLAEVNTEATNFKTWQFPTELVEDFKDSSGYWSSDAVPTINCWDFRFRKDKDEGWWRGMILDRDNPTSTNAYSIRHDDKDEAVMEWLYTPSSKPFAQELSHMLQVIYANGCHVAPFRYHSVRGLGFRLYDDARYEARARNRLRERALQEMLDLFKNVGLVDGREQLESIWLSHMGVLPQGTAMVPANERYRPDLDFILAAISETRESMAEQSTSYTAASMDESGDRETATKTMARVQESNQMISSFLAKAYEQWKHVGVEINRRFLRPNSTNSDVKDFRKAMIDYGIPEELLKPEYWDCEPERVTGNGNRIMATSMASNVMSLYNRLPPKGQRLALRMAVDASVDDPELAEAIVPLDTEDEASPTIKQAYSDIGTLMHGLPAPITSAENQIEYVETLLTGLGEMVQRAEQQGNMVDLPTLIGFATIATEIKKRIAMIAQDDGEKPRVKQYEDALTQIMNKLKGFAQRLQEQMKKRGQGMDPETSAKLQAILLTAQTNARIKEQSNRQKMQHKELAFRADQRRKDAESRINMLRTLHEAKVSAAATDIKTEAEIRNNARKAEEDSQTDTFQTEE